MELLTAALSCFFLVMINSEMIIQCRKVTLDPVHYKSIEIHHCVRLVTYQQRRLVHMLKHGSNENLVVMRSRVSGAQVW